MALRPDTLCRKTHQIGLRHGWMKRTGSYLFMKFQTAGIRVPRIYVRTMALSGALCGFAGFLAVSAVSHTLSTSTAGGRGFTAIIVAWLAKMNPFVMILISALLSFLDKGAVQIASDFGLNEYVSQIISGVILFFILGSEFFINYQVKTGSKHK